jgi:hypothetical protein
MIRNILGFLTVGLFLALAVSLIDCKPKPAYAVGFNVNYDSTYLYDSARRITGVWEHILGNEIAIISWGLDSVEVRYDNLENVVLKISQGTYQFHIYPKNKPENTEQLLWESWFVYEINSNKTLQFVATTEYFLVLLDTTNTWDFNTGWRSQGYQYQYYRSDTLTNFWPVYQADYYCGTQGVDSTEFIIRIDSAQAGTIYAWQCLQEFAVMIDVDLRGVMSEVEWTFHVKAD